MNGFYAGILLAVCSSLFIGASFVLKKKALLNSAKKDSKKRASAGGYGYLREWIWWSGVTTMGVGELLNFVAFTITSASLIAPLGALSVLVTSVLSSRFLDEKLNLFGKIGCITCVLGTIIVVLHSPKDDTFKSIEDVEEKIFCTSFVCYSLLILVVLTILICYVAPAYGQTNITVYICVCSLIGSFTVVACQCFGAILHDAATANNGLPVYWRVLACLLVLLICVPTQLIFLNKSLDTFNASLVTPIYYVAFTTCVVVTSSFLFRTAATLNFPDIVGKVCGFAVTVLGVFQMQMFKDVPVDFSHFSYLLAAGKAGKQQTKTTSSFVFRWTSGSSNNGRQELANDDENTSCLNHIDSV